MEVDDEEEEEEELHFSGQDLMKIRDAVVLLVQSLLRLLETFQLKDRPQSTSNCMQVAKSPPLYTTLHCPHIWVVYIFVFSLQIFCKLLYFEPVVGELTFAAVQWVFLFLSMSCSRIYQGCDRADNFFFCTEISPNWRVFLRWLSMACNCSAHQNMETRKK